jgi:hypothetical protein
VRGHGRQERSAEQRQSGWQQQRWRSSHTTRAAVEPAPAAPPEQPAAEGDATAGGEDGGRGDLTLLLFCRLPGEPYVFCGRLALAAHDLSSAPLAFTWRLLDAPALLRGSEHFRALLAASGVEVSPAVAAPSGDVGGGGEGGCSAAASVAGALMA